LLKRKELIQEILVERTRLSLFYLVGYMIPSGVMILVAPQFALKLLFSNGDYGNVFPRTAGMLLIGLGMMIF
jgi:cytochrome c biogenesis protein CcdA